MTRSRGSAASEAAKLDKGRIDEIGWAQIGEQVSTVLAMTRHGEREKVVRAFAFNFETYDNRIRRSVSAFEFVSTIDDPTLRESLMRADLTLVDLVALWATHDEAAALEAGRLLAKGQYSYQTLRDAERAARPKSRSTVSSRTAAWQDAAFAALIKGPARGYKRAAAPLSLTESPCDLWLAKNKKVVAVDVVGPYPNSRDYNRGVVLRVFAGLGLVHLGVDTWIALPVGTSGDRYRKHAERVAPGVLRIVELAMPEFADL